MVRKCLMDRTHASCSKILVLSMVPQRAIRTPTAVDMAAATAAAAAMVDAAEAWAWACHCLVAWLAAFCWAQRWAATSAATAALEAMEAVTGVALVAMAEETSAEEAISRRAGTKT